MKIAQRSPQLNRNPKWTAVPRRLLNRPNLPFASRLPSTPCRERKNPYIRLCDLTPFPPPPDALGGGISNPTDDVCGVSLAGTQPRSIRPKNIEPLPEKGLGSGKRDCTLGCGVALPRAWIGRSWHRCARSGRYRVARLKRAIGTGSTICEGVPTTRVIVG